MENKVVVHSLQKLQPISNVAHFVHNQVRPKILGTQLRSENRSIRMLKKTSNLKIDLVSHLKLPITPSSVCHILCPTAAIVGFGLEIAGKRDGLKPNIASNGLLLMALW